MKFDLKLRAHMKVKIPRVNMDASVTVAKFARSMLLPILLSTKSFVILVVKNIRLISISTMMAIRFLILISKLGN